MEAVDQGGTRSGGKRRPSPTAGDGKRKKRRFVWGDDLHAAFDRFDVDKSGTLDVAELSALCASLGQHLNHSEIEEAVHTLDSNRDGTVSYVEFVHWWQQGHDFSMDADDAVDTSPGQQLAATGGNAVV